MDSISEGQRKYKFGFIVGRFQGLHAGHEHLISAALEQCETLLILVGSAQEFGTLRNPFSADIRLHMLRKVYADNPRVRFGAIEDLTNENDHSHDWGRYLLEAVENWAFFFGITDPLDAMFYGNDEEREDWFDPEDIKGVAQVKLDRGEIPISATQMRGYLAWNSFNLWSKHVNPKIHDMYEELRIKLFEAVLNDSIKS